MRGKTTKKIRKTLRKMQVGSFEEFAETINAGSLRLRLKIIFKILIKKL